MEDAKAASILTKSESVLATLQLLFVAMLTSMYYAVAVQPASHKTHSSLSVFAHVCLTEFAGAPLEAGSVESYPMHHVEVGAAVALVSPNLIHNPESVVTIPRSTINHPPFLNSHE